MLFFFNWEGKGEGVRKDEGGCHVEGGEGNLGKNIKSHASFNLMVFFMLNNMKGLSVTGLLKLRDFL